MKAKRLLSCAFFGILAAGCRSPRPQSELKARFPIGIYGVLKPEDVDIVRQAGFDTIRTDAMLPEEQSTVAREVRRLGMRLVAYPNEARARLPADYTSDWPIAAWYIFDEPDVNHLTAPQLREISEETRRWDPRRAQVFVIGHSSAAKDYGHIADILMLDWYPVPHMPLDTVSDHIDKSYASMPPGKPLWAVLQAFDWRDYPQRDPAKKRVGRFPDFNELRYMSYASIVHAAKGIFFFTFTRPNGRTLPEEPENWHAVARLAGELAAFKVVLEKGRPAPELTSPGAYPVESRGWTLRGRKYAVVINRSLAPEKLPEEFSRPGWSLLFESKRSPAHLLKRDKARLIVPSQRVLVFTRG